jgi:hypothetical protein
LPTTIAQFGAKFGTGTFLYSFLDGIKKAGKS